MSSLEIVDWITPDALVLSLVGELGGQARHLVEERVHALLRTWPGIRVTIDLSSVSHADAEAAEELFLDLVASRSSGASLTLACPSAACQLVLHRLNIAYLSKLPDQTVAHVGVTV